MLLFVFQVEVVNINLKGAEKITFYRMKTLFRFVKKLVDSCLAGNFP